MARIPDGCLVPSGPLAELLRTFFDEWARSRPPTGGQFAAGGATTEVCPVRASEWLASASGIPEATIRNVAEGRRRMTELRVADALVSALGRPDMLLDGGPLPISPNPAASASSQQECCGGSAYATV